MRSIVGSVCNLLQCGRTAEEIVDLLGQPYDVVQEMADLVEEYPQCSVEELQFAPGKRPFTPLGEGGEKYGV